MATAISIDLTPISALAALTQSIGSVITAVGEVNARHRETMNAANRDRMDALLLNGLERWDRLCDEIDKFIRGSQKPEGKP